MNVGKNASMWRENGESGQCTFGRTIRNNRGDAGMGGRLVEMEGMEYDYARDVAMRQSNVCKTLILQKTVQAKMGS